MDVTDGALSDVASYSIKSNERTIVIGKTGSGKTYLCRVLTIALPRLIVFDTKGQISASAWRLREYSKRAMDAMARDIYKPGRLMIKQPLRGEVDWTAHLDNIMKLRNVVLYIDELNQLGAYAKQSDELRSVFTRGRELGIGIVAATQRPAWIPRESMTEAEHYIIFKLKAEGDNDRVYEFIGEAGLRELARYSKQSFVDLEKYQFLVYHEDSGEAKLYNRLDVKGETEP